MITANEMAASVEGLTEEQKMAVVNLLYAYGEQVRSICAQLASKHSIDNVEWFIRNLRMP